MISLSVASGPGLVHYLPIATTVIAVAFFVALLRRGRLRSYPPHLIWWSVGVFTFGIGTALESVITLFGNSPALTQWWYVAGALLGGYPLGTGSAYLLCRRRRTAHISTLVSGTIVSGLAVAVLLSPIDATALEAHRPSGDVIAWNWVRLSTPIVSLYAVFFLVGGAIWSAWRFRFPKPGAARDGQRALGTAAIALGGLLPGIGGALAKAGLVEALYVGELIGLSLIWTGHALCARSA